MGFQKFADISIKDAKVVPHNDPLVKKIKEQMHVQKGKNKRASVRRPENTEA